MKKLLSLLLISIALFTIACERDTTYDNFTQCLADSGTIFYGAFWCPHCQSQKELFGDSADLLPYVECDANGKNANPAACNAAGIKTYPTWILPDGTIETGTKSLEQLGEWTSCPLPGEESILVQPTED